MTQLQITASPTWKVYKSYLVPSMLSLLAVSLYSFTDTFVVGQAMGSVAVAAMGLGTPCVSIMYALGFLLGTGGAVRYSVLKSQNRLKDAQKLFTLSFVTVLVLGFSFALLGNLYIENIARFLGAQEDTLSYTVTYIRWIISLSVFLMMDIVLNAFMRNEGHPAVSAVATATGTGLNIVLDFVFVMGFKWGMGGAASATCIASVISVGINGIYCLVKKTDLKLCLKAFIPSEFLNILKIGLGSGILEGAVAIVTVVFLNAFGKYYGSEGISSYSVIITLNIFVYCLLNGVAQAMQPLVSNNYGAGKEGRCRTFFNYSLIISCGIAVLFIIVFEAFPAFVCSLFVKDDEAVMSYAVKALRLHSVSFFFMAVSIQTGIYFQAKENSLYSFLILLGRSVLLPVAVLLILEKAMGEGAVWISIPTGEGLAMVLSLVLLYISSARERKERAKA